MRLLGLGLFNAGMVLIVGVGVGSVWCGEGWSRVAELVNPDYPWNFLPADLALAPGCILIELSSWLSVRKVSE